MAKEKMAVRPIPLGALRTGAVFETVPDGIRAVKSEYFGSDDPEAWPYQQSQCILLSSGEYAHFELNNMTPVRELQVMPFEGMPLHRASIRMLLRELGRRIEIIGDQYEVHLDGLWCEDE